MSQHPLVAALGISQPPTATAHTGGIRVPSQQIIPANAITVVKELGAVRKFKYAFKLIPKSISIHAGRVRCRAAGSVDRRKR